MKIYNSIQQYDKVKTPVVSTGTFDGVHLGHQKLLERLRLSAEKINGETVVLTFFPHPRMALYPDDESIKLLNTMEEKTMLLENAGINHLIIQPFTHEFSRLSSLEYVRNILVNKIGVKKLVSGYNHHFGRNREGAFMQLKEYAQLYGFEIEEIPAKEIDDIDISSTKIRNALSEGSIKTANTYLGYDYLLSGKVIEGNGIGRKIGFPTANISVSETYKQIPQNGVYAVKINVDRETYDGMLNIGNRPTMNRNENDKTTQATIEVNIFDFEKMIYGEKLTIHFKDRIRSEKKFSNPEQLKSQLETDKTLIKNLLKNFMIWLSFMLCFEGAAAQLLSLLQLDTVYAFTSVEEALKQPENVFKLKLRNKKLTEIPVEVFDLPKLQDLNLGKNKIEHIQPEIAKLQDLQLLDLSKNKLKKLPPEIGTLKNLKHLAAFDNEIVFLPSEIGELENLEVLDIWGNNLEDLPVELGKLKNLKVIDLRVIEISNEKQKEIKEMLPGVKIFFSNSCNCGK